MYEIEPEGKKLNSWDSNAWPLQYQSSALPTGLSSQLVANNDVSSYCTHRWQGHADEQVKHLIAAMYLT